MKSEVPTNGSEVVVQHKDPRQFIPSNILMHTGTYVHRLVYTSKQCISATCRYVIKHMHVYLHTHIYMKNVKLQILSVCLYQ